MPDPEQATTLPLDEAAACPTCGYSLRALSGPQCPECGQELRISVRHPNPLWGRRGLLTLIFGWLLLAGTINATRTGIEVRQTMQTRQGQVWTVNFTGPNGRLVGTQVFNGLGPAARAGNTGPVTTTGGGITFDRDIVVTPSTRLQTPGRNTGLGFTTLPNNQVVTTFAPAAMNTNTWSLVSWDQWARLGAWSAIANVAVFGLVMLVLFRRRNASRRLVGVLTAIAWIGFSGYATYHAWTFVAELI